MSNLNGQNQNGEGLRTASSGETGEANTASFPESVAVYFTDLTREKQRELETFGYDGSNSPPFPLIILEKE